MLGVSSSHVSRNRGVYAPQTARVYKPRKNPTPKETCLMLNLESTPTPTTTPKAMTRKNNVLTNKQTVDIVDYLKANREEFENLKTKEAIVLLSEKGGFKDLTETNYNSLRDCTGWPARRPIPKKKEGSRMEQLEQAVEDLRKEVEALREIINKGK